MKHKLVKRLEAENKRLKAELRAARKEKINNCPMCSGVTDESLDRMKEVAMSKCH
jgi:hypothetical protein